MAVKKAKPYVKKTVLSADSPMDQAKEWFSANTGLCVGIGVGIVVLAVLVGSITFFVNSKNTRARSEYSLIAAGLPGDGSPNAAAAWKKVIPVLEAFISKYGNSSATLAARTDLAKGWFAAGSYAKAADTWQGALEVAPSDSGVKPLLLYQLAYAWEAAGKPDKARETWTALKKLGVPAMLREADWNLGRIFLAKKDVLKATEHFELASQEPGDYPPTPQIEQQIAAVKTAKAK